MAVLCSSSWQLFSCATNRCQFKLRSRRAETAAGQIFGSLMLHPQMCENDTFGAVLFQSFPPPPVLQLSWWVLGLTSFLLILLIFYIPGLLADLVEIQGLLIRFVYFVSSRRFLHLTPLCQCCYMLVICPPTTVASSERLSASSVLFVSNFYPVQLRMDEK